MVMLKEKSRLFFVKSMIVIVVCFSLVNSPPFYAANPEPVVVEVFFVTPIVITETVTMKFGLVKEGMALNETIVIATNNGTTDTGGNLVGSVARTAGEVSITATPLVAATIIVDALTSNGQYALSAPTCTYNDDAGTSASCGGTGMGVTTAGSFSLVEVGLTLTHTGSSAAGQLDGNFNITMTYD